MRKKHLSDNQFELLLLGEELEADAAEHTRACVVCRRRVDEWRRTISELQGRDPAPAVRQRVREAALAAWGVEPGRRRTVWWAAAAALVAAVSLSLLQGRGERGGEEDAIVVLAEVDALLAVDPVSTAFSSELVSVLAVEPEVHVNGGTS